MIPDPADVEGSVDVYLRKSPDDDIYVEDHYEDEIVPSVYEDFVVESLTAEPDTACPLTAPPDTLPVSIW